MTESGPNSAEIPTAASTTPRPFILGIGGTHRPGSSTSIAVEVVLRRAEAFGADVRLLGAEAVDFPMYNPGAAMPEQAADFLDAVHRADGLIIGTPAYHGTMSGLVKNALDYLEELREDERPYLHGRAVGCVACAAGWQAAVTALASLRSVVHALRGWPSPLGAAINSATPVFDSGRVIDEAVDTQLTTIAEQVMGFAVFTRGHSIRKFLAPSL